MSDTHHTADCRPHRRGRAWFLAWCAAIGVAFLVAGILAGHVGAGLISLGVMLCYGAGLMIAGRRSESAALLSGQARDERQRNVMVQALATTGAVLVVTLVVGMLVTMAKDSGSAAAWSGLCALGGLTFIGSTVWYARRG